MNRHGILGLLIAAMTAAASSAWAEQVTMNFDNLTRIGGRHAEAWGQPKMIATPVGKAVQFDGLDDSILIQHRPLVGAKTFTIEALFRPEGGPFAQRVIHMAETDQKGLDARPSGTADPNGRWMLEVRVTPEGQWYIDCFMNSKAGSKALIDPTKLHPLNQWFAIAQTYDGKTYRCFVDGALQAEAEATFAPLGPGRIRAGSRMNRIDYFTGSILKARFTDRAIPVDQFLKVSAGL